MYIKPDSIFMSDNKAKINKQIRKLGNPARPLIILRVTQVTVLTGVSSKETLNVHFSHLCSVCIFITGPQCKLLGLLV